MVLPIEDWLWMTLDDLADREGWKEVIILTADERRAFSDALAADRSADWIERFILHSIVKSRVDDRRRVEREIAWSAYPVGAC